MSPRALFAVFLVAVGLGLPAGAQDKKPAVTLTNVKLAELDKTIQGFKGKIVVVDIWSTT